VKNDTNPCKRQQFKNNTCHAIAEVNQFVTSCWDLARRYLNLRASQVICCCHQAFSLLPS
jgi:hypothetical protein